mgnify:CR=1 FL=1|tara:strand:+ start:1036 stop:1317 length:282 start_codon:yes stop_codon:yes gene_type:complete
MKATWNGVVIAESDDTLNIENNQYFPVESIKKEYFSDSETVTNCHWKGDANYYNITVDGKTNTDASWYYKTPSEMAKGVTNRVAFWKGVEITK